MLSGSKAPRALAVEALDLRFEELYVGSRNARRP